MVSDGQNNGLLDVDLATDSFQKRYISISILKVLNLFRKLTNQQTKKEKYMPIKKVIIHFVFRLISSD